MMAKCEFKNDDGKKNWRENKYIYRKYIVTIKKINHCLIFECVVFV
jgi:hypothetical protein